MAIIQDKYIFVHLPRTGGTSLIKWLMSTVGRHGILPLLDISEEDRKDKVKWGIIRNPFETYVSYYIWRRKSIEDFKVQKLRFKPFLKNFIAGSTGYYWVNADKVEEMDIGIATWAFIYLLCDYPKITDVKNFKKSHILADYILKYEPDLNQLIKSFYKKHSFELNYEQIENLERGYHERFTADIRQKPHTNYYTKELIDLVHHKDRLIFKLFPEYLWKK